MNLASLLFLATFAPDQWTPRDIEQVLAQKLEMKGAYTLRFRLEGSRPGAEKGAVKNWSFTAAVWRSGDKYRIDVFDRKAEPPQGEMLADGRHVTCHNCERQGYLLVTTVLPGAPVTTAQVEFRDLRQGLTDYFLPDIDWRFLGLCNSPINVYNRIPIAQSYRELLANPLLSVTPRDKNGGPCWEAVLGDEKTGSAIWFSRRERHNPILHTSSNRAGNDAVQVRTEVRWKVTPGKHLYPDRIKHTATRAGAEYYTETITIEHADFDSQVDPSAFTIPGLKLNENQVIGYPDVDPGDWPRWKDGRVDPSLSNRARARSEREAQGGAVSPSVQPPLAAYPQQGNRSLVVSIVAGAMSVVAIGFAAIYRRRRT